MSVDFSTEMPNSCDCIESASAEGARRTMSRTVADGAEEANVTLTVSSDAKNVINQRRFLDWPNQASPQATAAPS